MPLSTSASVKLVYSVIVFVLFIVMVVWGHEVLYKPEQPSLKQAHAYYIFSLCVMGLMLLALLGYFMYGVFSKEGRTLAKCEENLKKSKEAMEAARSSLSTMGVLATAGAASLQKKNK